MPEEKTSEDFFTIPDEKLIDVYDVALEKKVESLCLWGAARAAAVVVMPFLGTMALIANEVYLVKKIGDLHKQKLSESVVLGFIASLGASVVGSTIATIIPYSPMKIAVAASLTYGIGKSAHEWLKAGRPDDMTIFKKVFKEAQKDITRNIKKILEHPDRSKPLGDEQKDFRNEKDV